jgi:hypothetical protein
MAKAINEIKDFLTGQVTIIEIPWTKPELREQVANWRWARETAGITVGSQSVSTFREEMPVWLGMINDMSLRPGQTAAYEYKPRGGANVTLSPTQVARIYECFAWYVAACFATERTLIQMIDAGADLSTVATAAQNNATWPQTSFAWNPPSP